MLEKYGIDCKVGLSYPNSLKKYDFYIPLFDEYIEIAGMMGYEDYKRNIEFKKENFNSIILISENDIYDYFKNKGYVYDM